MAGAPHYGYMPSVLTCENVGHFESSQLLLFKRMLFVHIGAQLRQVIHN
jgi:hypothetical protein